MLMALGDLAGAERAFRAASESRSVGEVVGWAFVDYLSLGAVAYYRGDIGEAERLVRHVCEIEPATYQSGQAAAARFLCLAASSDVGAESALATARAYLPVLGRLASLGACGCLALVLEGLAIQGRSNIAAALEPAAEYVVANGPWCIYTQHLFRTAAGIAAGAARHWDRAEEHFRIALHQSDIGPYRVAQPVARLWYAAMLASRRGSGDRDTARVLLQEALHQCDAVGMPWYAERVRERLYDFRAPA